MINSVKDFKVGTVLKMSDGTTIHATSAVHDSDGIVRFSLGPVRQIGGSSAAIHGCALEASASRYWKASDAIDGLCYFLTSNLKVVSAHAPNEIDLSAVPYSVAPGLYELKGGGRLYAAKPYLLYGKGGEVTALTVDSAGHLITSSGTTLEPVVAGTVNDMVSPGQVSSKIKAGTIFASEHQGKLRVFVRKEHGIAPVDEFPHVPMSELSNVCVPLTTTVAKEKPQVGDVLEAGEAQFKVLDIDSAARRLWLLSFRGHVIESTISSIQSSMVESEFTDTMPTLDCYKASKAVEPVEFPAPSTTLAEIGDVVRVQGVANDMTLLVTSKSTRSMTFRTMVHREVLGHPTLQWHGTERSVQFFEKDGKYYGINVLENRGKLSLPGFGERVPGALYLMCNGETVVMDDRDDREAPVAFREVQGDATEPRCLTEERVGRWSIVAKLADPGHWRTVVSANGTPAGAELGLPERIFDAQGVKWPVSVDGYRLLEGLFNCQCPVCSTRTRGDRMALVYLTGQTSRTAVCRRCEEDMDNCPTCRAPIQSASNMFGVCPACYSAGNIRAIHCHSYKPKPAFRGDGPRYFGTEVELVPRYTGSRYDRERVARTVTEHTEGFIYGKNDGSIGEGIEFVSHPFSLPWLLANEDKMRSTFDLLKSSMQDSEDCGIHIHTSKLGFEATPESLPNGDKLTKERRITRGLLRVQRFIYGNPDLTIHFAGRVSSYASLDVQGRNPNNPVVENSDGGDGTSVSEMIRISRDLNTTKEERYSAMNMTEKTVEFRIFKSTTNFDEYKRNVLFLDAVIQYCTTTIVRKSGKVAIHQFAQFLAKNKELYAPVIAHLKSFDAAAALVAAAAH